MWTLCQHCPFWKKKWKVSLVNNFKETLTRRKNLLNRGPWVTSMIKTIMYNFTPRLLTVDFHEQMKAYFWACIYIFVQSKGCVIILILLHVKKIFYLRPTLLCSQTLDTEQIINSLHFQMNSIINGVKTLE